MDITVLEEVYAVLKQYIPTEDRKDAAEALAGVLYELLHEEDFMQFCDSDRHLHTAAQSFLEQDTDEDEDFYDE